jgi:hypothetical protein
LVLADERASAARIEGAEHWSRQDSTCKACVIQAPLFCLGVASLLLFVLGGKILWLLGLCMAAGAMAGG